MDLHNYFENTQGRGVLATSDAQGVVDVAVYTRPHFIKEDVCVFLMADRLSHRNLQGNPHAAYIFMEQSDKYMGKRLYLTKTEESEDQDMIDKLRRKNTSCTYDKNATERTFIVSFHVDSIRPLVGDDTKADQATENHCPTCQQKIRGSGHLCVPAMQEDEKCDWCGALIVEKRHLCNEKVKQLAYFCNSCGRAAVEAEHLCHPQEIEPGA